MLLQDVGGPQTGEGFTTSAINQQNNSLLGAPPTAQGLQGELSFDPQVLNSTNLQANPNVASMLKALKGGV